MAVVTSAVIAAVGTAYSISASEQQKNEVRKAGQKADREKFAMEKEQKNQKAKQDAEKARDTAYMRQQVGAASSDNLLGGDKVGANLDAGGSVVGGGAAPTKKIGETQSGKTLLGV